MNDAELFEVQEKILAVFAEHGLYKPEWKGVAQLALDTAERAAALAALGDDAGPKRVSSAPVNRVELTKHRLVAVLNAYDFTNEQAVTMLLMTGAAIYGALPGFAPEGYASTAQVALDTVTGKIGPHAPKPGAVPEAWRLRILIHVQERYGEREPWLASMPPCMEASIPLRRNDDLHEALDEVGPYVTRHMAREWSTKPGAHVHVGPAPARLVPQKKPASPPCGCGAPSTVCVHAADGDFWHCRACYELLLKSLGRE